LSFVAYSYILCNVFLSTPNTPVALYYELERKNVKMFWYFGAPPKFIYFENYDSIGKVILTSIMTIPWLVLNSFWIVPCLLLGCFAYASKFLAFTPVYDIWMRMYTGGDEYSLSTFVDSSQMNIGQYSETFESIPELIILIINSLLLNEMNKFTVFSVVMSSIMIADIMYQLIYYKIYLGIPIESIDIGLEENKSKVNTFVEMTDNRLNGDELSILRNRMASHEIRLVFNDTILAAVNSQLQEMQKNIAELEGLVNNEEKYVDNPIQK
jgi:hypothetical protein